MKKVENMTKAELIQHLEKEKNKVAALEKEKEIMKENVDQDMSFSATPKERTEKQKKQDHKDFIKRMTHGRWTSEEKYQEFISKQRKAMRMS